ncbi:MAG TPA: TIGR01777 family oxidoreductase [Streptosporangiaceae bacterium]|nr:TIGR01777 family oxidoreductase [Streptosporangiaceae bacterium]
MKIAITGASGLVGRALVASLRADGHEVVRLVRREPTGADEARWDPFGAIDAKALEGVDAVVNLAGAGIGDRRWTESYKRQIRDSRVVGTRNLAETLAGLAARPRVLVSASGMNFYGDTGDRETDETAPAGAGFLADLARDWEAAAAPAAAAGIRVVHARSGHVLAPDGGLLGRLLPLFKLGLGGRLGAGRQWMSWITRDDHIAALRLLIDGDLAGPVNLTAPSPVTNADFTKALGRAVRRPAFFSVPPVALRAALDGLADEGALISLRIVPGRLTAAGFAFRHPELDGALADLL